MAPRRACCYRGDRASSPDVLAARHPILRRHRPHNASSSTDANEEYGNSSTELSVLFQPQVLFPHHRISEDSILPDPRALGGGDSPSTMTNTGTLTSTGLTGILRHRFSKESRQHFKDTRQQRKLQKKSTPRLKHKDSTVTMDDLVGLQLAQRTPSRGGYDADAQLFTDASLLARLQPDQNAGNAIGRQRKPGDGVTTPLRQRRPIARMPAAVRGSPLIKVHKPSYSEESASDTVGRTSTSTYTFGTPGTPFTEEDTGTVATQIISSLDDTTKNTNTLAGKPAVPDKVSQATEATYKSSSGSSELQRPRFINRLSLKDFSQSSLHLTGPLQRPDTSLSNIAELADTSPAGRAIAAPTAVRSKPYSQTHVAMRTSAPHLHNMRISQHLRSLSYYSDDAEQVPDAKQPEQEPMVQSKQDTLDQPQLAASLAPKIRLTRNTSTEDKSNHSITRARNDSVMYDGQVDLLVPPPATGRRSSSISEDYEDTAAVWQKALNSYQAEKTIKDKRRASSSAATTGSPMRRSRAGSAANEDHELHQLEPHDTQAVLAAPVVELPHIETEHSFAQVPLPGRRSIAHGMFSPPTADNALQAVEDLSEQRVGSPWPAKNVTLFKSPAKESGGGSRALKAWARFAQEDTEERNGSAGITDNVITRDFAASSPPSPADCESKHASSPKKKTSAAKVKKLLSEIPSLFKNRGPHNRQLGHRSSIAPGAELEFPELELLPGGASQEVSQLDAWKNAMDSGPGRERLMSMDEQDPMQDNSQSNLISFVGSSDYGSSPGSPVGSVTSNQRGRSAAPVWNDQYLVADPSRNTATQRGTDLGSHLDGASKEWLPAGNPYTMNAYGFSSIKSAKSIKDSPGSKSLPPTLQAKWLNPSTPVSGREKGKGKAKGGSTGSGNRPMLEKIASTEGLRRSTQDLNMMLERSARVEAERAVRAAESWGV